MKKKSYDDLVNKKSLLSRLQKRSKAHERYLAILALVVPITLDRVSEEAVLVRTGVSVILASDDAEHQAECKGPGPMNPHFQNC